LPQRTLDAATGRGDGDAHDGRRKGNANRTGNANRNVEIT
jgi:hypothetical protein